MEDHIEILNQDKQFLVVSVYPRGLNHLEENKFRTNGSEKDVVTNYILEEILKNPLQ